MNDPLISMIIVTSLALLPLGIAIHMESYGKTWGILFQRGGMWIGAHYSTYNRRWCINIIPCVTWWICMEGGKAPDRATINAYTTGV